jgi:tungstate transport system ATP-binding protein
MMRDPASILPLALENLSFIREGQCLLNGVSLTIPRGGITAIIGPNGAGKSLLLRLCNGLIEPSVGAIRWSHDPRHRHALVFQRPVMLRRSVRANIAHSLNAIGRDDVRNRTEQALQRFDLAALSERPARLLSGGEQQRLAIARAWSLSPDILFLDEPTSQLDPGNTRDIEALIAALATEGMTLVLTTHDLGQARRLADRILFMHRGRVVEDAAAAAFFASPNTAEARAFLAGDLLR